MARLLIGTEMADSLAATQEDTVILGFGGPDSLAGGAGNDLIWGGAGDDTLLGDGAGLVTDDPATHLGGGGDDILLGGKGNDTLAGGFGTDIMAGGPGHDVFAFGVLVFYVPSTPGFFISAAVDTGVGPGQRDLILDFTQGEDKIDLSAINFFERRPPNDVAFDFIGNAPFSATQGHPEVRYEIEGDHTVIQLDGASLQYPTSAPPDGQADAEIELAGVIQLTAQDFIL